MKAQLRIIQVVNVRWFNATAWYGLFLSRLLKDAGHTVLVLGLEGTDSFRKAREMGLEPVGLDLNTANPLRFAALLPELSNLLRRFRPHIVNCHRGEGMALWGLLKTLGHSFALVRTRGDQRPARGNLPNRILHNRLADAVIATNSRTAREIAERLGTKAERIRIILGGVDSRRFRHTIEGRAAVRRAFGFADDHLVVGLLGRFDAVKGQRELIEAVARIRSADASPWRGRIRLMLAGFPATTPQETVEGWLREYSLADRAVITGRQEDVPACISAMDLGVIASQGSEAIARAALEILACGVPLVGTSVGVMPDLLPDWALVPPGDGSALAALLEKALADELWRARLRDAGTQRMADLSEQDFLRQTLQAYHEALDRCRISPTATI